MSERATAVPKHLMAVWRRFDAVPMETLTKAWISTTPRGSHQRSVERMERDHRRHGTGGNCFDLALWLLRDLASAGIPAHAVGHDVLTEEAHVAVVAVVQGEHYLCDLGDMWIRPAPLGRPWAAPEAGWFPAAHVVLRREPGARSLTVDYHRPGGRMSTQTYDLAPIPRPVLERAAERSQHRLDDPLVERRLARPHQTDHWEFWRWSSWLSTHQGLYRDAPLASDAAWAKRVESRAGIEAPVVLAALTAYRRRYRG